MSLNDKEKDALKILFSGTKGAIDILFGDRKDQMKPYIAAMEELVGLITASSVGGGIGAAFAVAGAIAKAVAASKAAGAGFDSTLSIQSRLAEIQALLGDERETRKFEQLGEALSEARLARNHLRTAIAAHPPADLYPWGDSDEESLRNMQRQVGAIWALNSLGSPVPAVWFTSFRPAKAAGAPWSRFLHYMHEPAPKNLQLTFDCRESITIFYEFATTLLLLIASKTPQFRSLGIHSEILAQMADVAHFVADRIEAEVRYFWKFVDDGEIGGGGPGWNRPSGADTYPNVPQSVPAGERYAVGATIPGMMISVMAVPSVILNPPTTIGIDIRQEGNKQILIDRVARTKLLETVGIGRIRNLAGQLRELSLVPWQSETVAMTFSQDGAEFGLADSWNYGQPDALEVGRWFGTRIQRATRAIATYRIMPQRETSLDVPIPKIDYEIALYSIDRVTRAVLNPQGGVATIEVGRWRDAYTSAEGLAQTGKERNWLYGSRYLPANLYSRETIDIEYRFIGGDDPNERILVLEFPYGMNAECFFEIVETLPETAAPRLPMLSEDGRMVYRTRAKIEAVGNAVIMPEAFWDFLHEQMLREMSESARTAIPYLVDLHNGPDGPASDLRERTGSSSDSVLSLGKKAISASMKELSEIDSAARHFTQRIG